MKRLLSILAFSALCTAAIPATASAASLEYSGWIPYWAAKTGARDAEKHIDQFTEINPFTYSVKKDGSIQDLGKMKDRHWKKLIAAAKRNDVRVVPTVMWSDGANIDRMLRDPELRELHVEHIARMVEAHDYDGVDIDYEGKWAETKEYFSLFLTELNEELDDKWLSCTIEARMPVEDRYTGTPPSSAYLVANDYTVIARQCDRVRLMTYDQQTADQKLNAANKNAPYYPIADIRWVEKVVNLTDNDIPKDKLAIGVATYGRELIVTVTPEGKYSYKSDGAFNPNYAKTIEKKYKVKRSENSAGEQTITYVAKKRSDPTQKELMRMAPSGTPSGLLVAAGAREYAKEEGVPVSFHMLWWSDAAAIADKVALAKDTGVAGVAVFKIDGNEDRGLWSVLD